MLDVYIVLSNGDAKLSRKVAADEYSGAAFVESAKERSRVWKTRLRRRKVRGGVVLRVAAIRVASGASGDYGILIYHLFFDCPLISLYARRVLQTI